LIRTPYAPLRFPFKLLEPIARRDAHVGKNVGRIELEQQTTRFGLDVGRQLAATLTVPDLFGFLVGEIADHR
jgi:hypothetical protein